MYNINPDYNREIVEQNDVLKGYTQCVECVKKHTMAEAKGGPVTKEVMERALDLAIAECIENHILEDFLKTRGDEVRRNIMVDYTFERRLKLNQEENQEIINQLTAENNQQAAEISQLETELKQQKDRILQLEKLLANKGTNV